MDQGLTREEKMARVLVDYSSGVQPGDKVVIEATTAAEPLVRGVFRRVLERGGHPHLLLALPDQEELMLLCGSQAQLEYAPALHKLAAESFDARIRIYSEVNTRAMSQIDPLLQAQRAKAIAEVQRIVTQRGADGSLRWVSTQYPTAAYAMEAEMSLTEYADFHYRACHADEGTADPVAYWQSVAARQQRYADYLSKADQVLVKGTNVDLALSVKGRRFLNSCGHHNLPDGEIYTGPIEESVNGWVRFTYPAVYGGRVVEGVELTFVAGKVVKAQAARNEAFLLKMLETDAGARFVGEFALGLNYEINRSTRNILFDEKIGGSFHMALGASYPETGGRNTSVIHWDMVCDLKDDSQIVVDGELAYRAGQFLF